MLGLEAVANELYREDQRQQVVVDDQVELTGSGRVE
jgi:hypothetical protein